MSKQSIYVPRDLLADQLIITELNIQMGERVRRGEVLFQLTADNVVYPIVSPCDGRVNTIAKKVNASVALGELIVIIDMLSTDDYRADGEEITPHTEYDRRRVEREEQRIYSEGYSDDLFQVPEKGNCMQAHSLREHPFTKNMKEGVPAKMTANAAENNPAIDHLAEEASQDPKLQKQLSSQLQQRLQISPAPSSAPSPSPH